MHLCFTSPLCYVSSEERSSLLTVWLVEEKKKEGNERNEFQRKSREEFGASICECIQLDFLSH